MATIAQVRGRAARAALAGLRGVQHNGLGTRRIHHSARRVCALTSVPPSEGGPRYGWGLLMGPGACVILSTSLYLFPQQRADAGWWPSFGRQKQASSPFTDPRLHQATKQRKRADAEMQTYLGRMRHHVQDLKVDLGNRKVGVVQSVISSQECTLLFIQPNFSSQKRPGPQLYRTISTQLPRT